MVIDGIFEMCPSGMVLDGLFTDTICDKIWKLHLCLEL